MYRPANIFLQSYVPTQLELGMYFKNEHSYIQYGNQTPIYELWELKELPDDTDAFLAQHGSPVKPVIGLHTDDNPDVGIRIVAPFEQIGWIEYDDVLHELELRDLNYLLMEFQGNIGLYMEEKDDSTPYLEEGKVVICPIDQLYEEEEYD